MLVGSFVKRFISAFTLKFTVELFVIQQKSLIFRCELYMQLAESTDNKLVKEVLKDIADEERVHAGEFSDFSTNLRLMRKNFTLKVHRKLRKR